MSELNIYQRLSKITSELGTVNKNLNVSTGKSSYKAVSERDIKDAVKPLEEKYGVLSYPIDKEIIESDLVEDAAGRRYRYMRLRVVTRFVNIDKPEEYVDVIGYGDGLDSGDKAPGKADTYAYKYCLMSCYKISTGDDPDQNASDESGYKNVPRKASENQVAYIRNKCNEGLLNRYFYKYGVNRIEDFSVSQASEIIGELKRG